MDVSGGEGGGAYVNLSAGKRGFAVKLLGREWARYDLHQGAYSTDSTLHDSMGSY